jgi:hypothetical protein
MHPLVVSPRACTWNPWSPSLSPETLPVTVVGPKQQPTDYAQRTHKGWNTEALKACFVQLPSPSWVKKMVPLTPSLPESTATAFTIVYVFCNQTRRHGKPVSSVATKRDHKTLQFVQCSSRFKLDATIQSFTHNHMCYYRREIDNSYSIRPFLAI